MKRKKYLLFGAEMVNKGAQAMLFITTSRIRENIPDASIYVYLYNKWDAASDPNEFDMIFKYIDMAAVLTVLFKPLGYLFALLKHKDIKTMKIRADSARECFSGAVAIDLSGFALSDQWGFGPSLFYLLRLRALDKCGADIYIMPQSFGPFSYGNSIYSAIIKRLIQKEMGKAKIIYAREKEGYNYLVNDYRLRNVELSADLVLRSRGPDYRRIFREGSHENHENHVLPGSVAIIPNLQNFIHGNRERILGLYRKIAGHLVGLNKNVYLAAHSQQDEAVCRELYSVFSDEGVMVYLIAGAVSCEQFERLVKSFDYIIASRYHAIVHAFKNGIPCIALGWAAKYGELLSLFGQNQYAFDVRNAETFVDIHEAIVRMNENYRTEHKVIAAKVEKVRDEGCFSFLKRDRNIMVAQQQDVCISCGICKAVCPAACIKYGARDGLYIPVIDSGRCVECGVCMENCPGIDFGYLNNVKSPSGYNPYVGSFAEAYHAALNDKETVQSSASGGIVTGLVGLLLETGLYEGAFLVSGYDYRKQLSSQLVSSPEELSGTGKSRYLPVSHTKAVRYMLDNRKKRLIIAGTSCAIHGFKNVIRNFGLDSERYFFIGLFCDKTLTYNCLAYFSRKAGMPEGKLTTELYFRSKDNGGWPGGMRVRTDKHTMADLDAAVRIDVKEYFQPERCLYCLDKLNRMADISVGDNYTAETVGDNGSSSVIIRTALGKKIWQDFRPMTTSRAAAIEEIVKSQNIGKRKENVCYISLKKSDGIIRSERFCNIAKAKKRYEEKLRKIELGKSRDFDTIEEEVKRNFHKKLMKKVWGKLLRAANRGVQICVQKKQPLT